MPSAWNRLFLRSDTPASSPGETELSTALPSGTGSDLGGAVQSLSPFIGSSQTSISANGQTSTSHQDNFFTSFSTPPLQADTYGAGTWEYAISCNEANANANSFFVFSLYIYRPSTASVVGYIYDSDTPLGTEWPTSQGGRGTTFTGSGIAAANSDILVLEVWRHATQSKSGPYAQTIYFNGTTVVGNGDSVTNAASWITAPGEIAFMPRLRTVSTA